MSLHLQRAIDKLKRRLLSLSAVVEENLHRAVKAVHDRDEALARRVIEEDLEIDQAEVDVEEECLMILALHQPVAVDLRFLVSALKINKDLERIGDLAANVAERAIVLANTPVPERVELDLSEMAEKTEAMLRKSIDALVNTDLDLARQVWAADDEVDALNRKVYVAVKKAIPEHLDHLDALILFLSASRHLERAADHATNIAKDVIYMIEGEIVRHRAGESKKRNGQGARAPDRPRG